jgi:hypothetical protein
MPLTNQCIGTAVALTGIYIHEDLPFSSQSRDIAKLNDLAHSSARQGPKHRESKPHVSCVSPFAAYFFCVNTCHTMVSFASIVTHLKLVCCIIYLYITALCTCATCRTKHIFSFFANLLRSSLPDLLGNSLHFLFTATAIDIFLN